jgi:hypothetical protein
MPRLTVSALIPWSNPAAAWEGVPDEPGFVGDIYFCSACGERVGDFKGRRTPDGGIGYA